MSNKRFISISEFQRQSGLSYATIKHALETGELTGIKTETGLWKLDTAAGQNVEAAAIIERLDSTQRLLETLCNHLGIGGQRNGIYT